MDLRLDLYRCAAEHQLDADGTTRLERAAGLGDAPSALARRVAQGLAVLAAALVGLGLVFWVAAHWESLGRLGRFALLQGTLAVMALGALLRPAARVPLSLLVLLASGALLAYFGQTYQTGADAWQLFALWAALLLPLALGLRSDVLWAPWALVAMTAVALWVQTHTGHGWRAAAHDLPAHAAGWALALGVLALLGPPLRLRTGAGVWAWRSALTLAVVLVSASALGGLFQPSVAGHYALGLMVLAALAAMLAAGPARWFDIFGLSAAALGLNALLFAGLARWLFDSGGGGGEPLGRMLLLGVVAAGLLAATVSVILRLNHAHEARQQPRLADEPPVPAQRGPAHGSALDIVLQHAVASGLLPAGTTAAAHDSRPWPVVLLIALGAWLAALPLLAVVGLLLGDVLQQGVGPYVVGVLLLAAAAVVLRSREVPVFVEQLALPALLVGLLSLGLGLFRDLDRAAAAALLSLLCLVLAAALPRAWLRVLLGAAAALLCALAFAPRVWTDVVSGGPGRLWLALHILMGLWLAALAVHGRLSPRPRAALESVQAGWLLATLAGLAGWSGMTMLAGASLGGGAGGDIARMSWQMGRTETLPMQLVSMLLALAAAAWSARQWSALRRAWCAATAVIVAALAFTMPTLGAALLALVLSATSSRWRLAAAAALAAAWIVGAFYYALAWPLQLKALVLLGAGAGLGAVAAWAWRAQHAPVATTASAAAAPMGRARLGVALTAVAALVVTNAGIWQKEALIARGQPIFVELVPVDPRSLMQGDFMALRFALPTVSTPPAGLLQPTRPRVLARRDARGVATLHALDAGARPMADDLLIELTPKDGDWVLVTDAWFFTEGEAARWAAARYGEFRVDASGRALLVGLRGAQLQPL